MGTEHDARPWLARYPAGLPHHIDPPHTTALAMFRAAVAARPDAPFVHYFGTTHTYAEIDRLSDALAAGLVARGLVAGDRVALYLQNVPQFPIAMLAAWKAGAIPACFNPMLKAREVRTLLDAATPRVLVCLQSLYHDVVAEELAEGLDIVTTNELDLLDDDPVPMVLAGIERRPAEGTTDLLALCLAHEGDSVDEPDLGPDDVAALTFTSGTTGPPKGAMNTHGNVVFNAEVWRTWTGVAAEDVVLCVAPLFHITGFIAHLAVAMATATPLVLAYRFDAVTSLELIERHRATYAVAAITAFSALLHEPSRPSRDTSSLRKVWSGGSPVPAALAEAFEAAFEVPLHNAYGLTEATSATHLVPSGVRAPIDPDYGALSIGVPVFDTLARILDDDGAALPPGQIGELSIRGPQIVPGYWGQPEETARAFPDGELRTGDVAYMDADGWFFVVDRRKDQINASGYKVWPREVEDVLYEHPAVREAAVVGVPDEYRGETVKAYVCLVPGAEVGPDELIAFCRDRMAAYKYPRLVELVDELPKTASGKVLRRELRERG